MIPVLAIILGMFVLTVCVDLIRREQERVGGATFASFMAVLTILVAVGGVTWILRASHQAEQELERAQQQLESIQWP